MEKPQRLRDLLNDETLAPVAARATWFDDLSAEIREELIEARTLWRNGEIRMSAHRAAAKLRAALHRRGLEKIPSQTSVSVWLRNSLPPTPPPPARP